MLDLAGGNFMPTAHWKLKTANFPFTTHIPPLFINSAKSWPKFDFIKNYSGVPNYNL
jgi:hypothetical protein